MGAEKMQYSPQQKHKIGGGKVLEPIEFLPEKLSSRKP